MYVAHGTGITNPILPMGRQAQERLTVGSILLSQLQEQSEYWENVCLPMH